MAGVEDLVLFVGCLVAAWLDCRWLYVPLSPMAMPSLRCFHRAAFSL